MLCHGVCGCARGGSDEYVQAKGVQDHEWILGYLLPSEGNVERFSAVTTRLLGKVVGRNGCGRR